MATTTHLRDERGHRFGSPEVDAMIRTVDTHDQDEPPNHQMHVAQ